jgi:2-polyprenyl-3-methyl-5-hydroxy-6-metoxy-1,4-benzoquinol methylase
LLDHRTIATPRRNLGKKGAERVCVAAVEPPQKERAYIVDGERLSAQQCRALLGALPFSDRHKKVLERIEGDSVVDIGCYSGPFVQEASRRFPEKSITGVDYSEDVIAIARLLYPHLAGRFRRMSIYHLDLADGSVDCVTLQEVLEHLEGAALAVKEINRVLKPCGTLIVSVPNPFYLWRIATFTGREIGNLLRRLGGACPQLATEVLCSKTEWDRHVHAWTPESLLTLLAANGFAYVEHCYETRTPDRLRRWLFAALPFFGPTLILKVRKLAPAPAQLI